MTEHLNTDNTWPKYWINVQFQKRGKYYIGKILGMADELKVGNSPIVAVHADRTIHFTCCIDLGSNFEASVNGVIVRFNRYNHRRVSIAELSDAEFMSVVDKNAADDLSIERKIFSTTDVKTLWTGLLLDPANLHLTSNEITALSIQSWKEIINSVDNRFIVGNKSTNHFNGYIMLLKGVLDTKYDINGIGTMYNEEFSLNKGLLLCVDEQQNLVLAFLYPKRDTWEIEESPGCSISKTKVFL